jgi:hypothetical protein
MIAQHALEEAVGHLGAAIQQSLPSDDQIIMHAYPVDTHTYPC